MTGIMKLATTNCPYHIFTDVIRSRMKTQRFNHCSTKMVLKIMLLEMTIIKHGVLSTRKAGEEP